MNKKLISKVSIIIASFAMLSMVAIKAEANLVSFDQPNYDVDAGSMISLDVMGTFDIAPDAGGFSLNFDPTVLSYRGTTMANPPWDTATISDTSVATGLVDFAFFGTSGAPVVPAPGDSSFSILSFEFDVIGAPGDISSLILADVFGGVWAAGGQQLVVEYSQSQVQVTGVPVPAAVWLFGSALLGLMTSKRLRVNA